jgi:ribonuclease PH
MLIRQFARPGNSVREISFIPHVTRSADGSCVIKAGNTHVLCTASLDVSTTGLHVEFGQVPSAQHPRISRAEMLASFETQHIQNALQQSLSMALDVDVLSKVGLYLDCDVLQSEGGILSSCVSGGFVALALALKKWAGSSLISKMALVNQIAGISCGLIKGEMVLDLDQQESSQADVLGDFVFSSDEQVVDIHIKAQRYAVPFSQIHEMSNMALRGVRSILDAQKRCLNG